MYMFVRGFEFDSFYNFSIGFGNCLDSDVFFFFILLHKLNTGLQSVVYQNKYYINKHTDFQQSRHLRMFY